ncbi:hypothetical protein [Helicobacter pylori]|uniref:hypothetical protein n=1 Tax=Helicobacter pylori TaxID=210 RepID=UPI0003FE79BC|nr:hypothetical protein [Helicobacter pylori]
MRQKKETSTIFNRFNALAQITQALKKRIEQISDNANISEIASQSALKPKTVRIKNHALKPTKKAFSDRQITTIKDNSQASANKSLETKESNHANAFKSDEKNTRRQE